MGWAKQTRAAQGATLDLTGLVLSRGIEPLLPA
jgi:hypothetical protein